MLLSVFFTKVLKILPDRPYIQLKYFIRSHGFLNLKNPRTFNEKLNWLKLHCRRDIFTKMVDKYEARDFVAERVGEEHLVPLLGVWSDFEEIDFDRLPDKFVLKCTNNSGGTVFCTDKKSLDLEAARTKIQGALKTNYFWFSREWPYKNVRPRIIAEAFVEEKNVCESASLVVYKVFCFDGKPHIIQVIQNDKKPGEVIDYYDTDWNLLKLRQNYPNSGRVIEKNALLSEMLELSKVLSKGIPFVRVDWYMPDDRLLFSEHTFFSDGGFAKFEPAEWDRILGDLIVLP